jgi:hypothetical protein
MSFSTFTTSSDSVSVRGSLSTRRAYNLHIDLTSIAAPLPTKGPLGPTRFNLPRRTRKTLPASASAPAPAPNFMNMKAEAGDLYHLHELMPGLHLSFWNQAPGFSSNVLNDARAKDLGHFTHVITIVPQAGMLASEQCAGAVEVFKEKGDDIRRLRLVVSDISNDDGRTNLTLRQIVASRDLLMDALKYPKPSERCIHENHRRPSPGTSARVLIAVPYDRAVDAMTIAAACIAYSAETFVDDVLLCISGNEDNIPEPWRGVVSADGIEIIEAAVRV